MNLIEMKCPGCGADLQINPILKSAQCNYCGKQFIVEQEHQQGFVDGADAREKGFEFERGRNDAQNAGADPALLGQISALIEGVRQREALAAETNAAYDKLKQTIAKADECSSPKAVLKMLGIAALAFLIVSSITHAIIGFPAGVGVFVLCLMQNKKKSEALENEVKASRKEWEILNYRLTESQQQADYSLVPASYQDLSSLQFIYNALFNKRALTIPDAINLYENYKHQKQMEYMQQQQLELQRQNAALQMEQIKLQQSNSSLQMQQLRMQQNNAALHQQQIALQQKNAEELQRIKEDTEELKNREDDNGLKFSDIIKAGSAVAITMSVIKKIKKL